MNTPARLYNCVLCHCQVQICSDCDRGNIYCQRCAPIARQNSLRHAGIKYQSTLQGKKKHAARQQRYRAQLKQKVTHQGSQQDMDKAHCSTREKASGLCCHFCKKPITEYLRSVFLSRFVWGTYDFGKKLPQGP